MYKLKCKEYNEQEIKDFSPCILLLSSAVGYTEYKDALTRLMYKLDRAEYWYNFCLVNRVDDSSRKHYYANIICTRRFLVKVYGALNMIVAEVEQFSCAGEQGERDKIVRERALDDSSTDAVIRKVEQ